jgi:Zn-dependent M28 family amino/carboxypeptidase
VAALGVACHGSQSEAQRFDAAQAMSWVRYQVAAGPRVPGRPGHRLVAEWLERELRARAESVEVQAFTHVTVAGDTLALRNIIARFRPSDPNRILYLTHWDTRPVAERDPDSSKRNQPIPGANDGASGTALLLGVAAALKKTPPAVGVDLLFVDGEDYGSFETDSLKDVLIGARYFARHLPAGYRPLFAVLWDMVGGRDQQIYEEGYSLERAPEVVERVWSMAEELHLGPMFRTVNGGFITDDHVPLLEAGIRAIDVIGYETYRQWHHTLQDTMDKMSEASLGDVGRLALALVH